jgi:hypothetical protein
VGYLIGVFDDFGFRVTGADGMVEALVDRDVHVFVNGRGNDRAAIFFVK